MISQQQGSTLVIVLILVFVMTWLLLSVTEANILAHKMSDHFYHQRIAFEAAEAGLISEEAVIQHQFFTLPIYAAKIKTKHQLIDEDACYKKRYQIIASAEYQNATVVLESVYDYLPQPTIKCMAEKINQRIFWKTLPEN